MNEDKNKGLIDRWTKRIEAGKAWRKKVSDQDKWVEYRKMYRGAWKDDIIPVNRVFSYGRSMLPRVYFRAPRVTVTAKKPDFVFHARVVEEIDNWLIRELFLKQTLKKAALTAYLNGIGPIKLGYDSEYGYIPEQAADQDSATATMHSKKDDRKIEYQVGVRPGMPWALPELPENIIVPFGYATPTSLPWIAHRILRPIEDVKQDQKYKNTKDLKGTRASSIHDIKKAEQSFPGLDDILLAELYEIRDTSEKRMITISEQTVLLDRPDALQIEGLPWEFIIFNEDPEYFWPIPDVKMIEKHQMDLNLTSTQQKQHKAIALIKFLYLKDAIKETELDKFLSGEVGPAVAIDGESLANSIVPLQPHVPPDLYSDKADRINEMRETLGYSENRAGVFKGGTPPTAAETMQVESHGNERDLERRDAVGDTLVNIIRKFNQYLFTFWTSERVIQIAGPDGAKQWVSYTGDQLIGEYSLEIDPDSGFPISRVLRHEMGTALLDKYNGDKLIDQVRLRMAHLQNYEWVFPGISQLLNMVDPNMAAIVANQRQPNSIPGKSLMLGNRGGGRSAGNPIPFEKAKALSEGK